MYTYENYETRKSSVFGFPRTFSTYIPEYVSSATQNYSDLLCTGNLMTGHYVKGCTYVVRAMRREPQSEMDPEIEGHCSDSTLQFVIFASFEMWKWGWCWWERWTIESILLLCNEYTVWTPDEYGIGNVMDQFSATPRRRTDTLCTLSVCTDYLLCSRYGIQRTVALQSPLHYSILRSKE